MTEFEIWRAELAGAKPKRSGWPLVLIGLAFVIVALAGLR